MKRRFLPTTRASLLVLVCIALLAFFFIFRGVSSSVLQVVQKPFTRSSTWISNSVHVEFFQSEERKNRIKQLEEQRNALAVDTAELEHLQLENQQLRDQIGFNERLSHETVTASVVARTSSTQVSKFVIDRGRVDGLRDGLPVIVGPGYLVGKITDTREQTSTVTAITDPSMATASTLLNQSRTIGVLQGSGGKLLTLDYIPHEELVEEQHLVVTSGLEEDVVSGLLVGIITKVDSQPTAPFQQAIVEPLVNVNEYNIVSVIVPSDL